MTAARTYTTESGQQVSELSGQPGRVITGRPAHVGLRDPNLVDLFGAFDSDGECLTCPPGMPCTCTAGWQDDAYDSDRDYDCLDD